ncbi:hypothetical protein A6R68_17795, partial [Neotoma lepida]
AITISPRNSCWKNLKVKSPRDIDLYISVFCVFCIMKIHKVQSNPEHPGPTVHLSGFLYHLCNLAWLYRSTV